MNKSREIEKMMQPKQARLARIKKFIADDVTILDPLTTYIDGNVKIGKGTVIYPLTVIESNVQIGKNCSIGPFTRLRKGTKL